MNSQKQTRYFKAEQNSLTSLSGNYDQTTIC